jgi:hypothetical protein
MEHFIFVICYFMWCLGTLIALHIMLILAILRLDLHLNFYWYYILNMFIWRRLGVRLIRLGVRKGVAPLASPYAFKTLVLILTQDRCTVCAEHTIGSEIILDAHVDTPR